MTTKRIISGCTAANFPQEHFYIKDGLKSVPTVEEAVILTKDVEEMCKRGGFNLHKFVFNSKEVIHDPVPAAIKAKWAKWPSDLHHLPEFSVARCCKPKSFGHMTKTELYHISDTSSKGYGQCS